MLLRTRVARWLRWVGGRAAHFCLSIRGARHWTGRHTFACLNGKLRHSRKTAEGFVCSHASPTRVRKSLFPNHTFVDSIEVTLACEAVRLTATDARRMGTSTEPSAPVEGAAVPAPAAGEGALLALASWARLRFSFAMFCNSHGRAVISGVQPGPTCSQLTAEFSFRGEHLETSHSGARPVPVYH